MSQDFSKGKIYKITNDYNDDVYVGSTCDTLVKRFSAHKKSIKDTTKNHLPLYKLMNEIGIDRFRIELIENYSSEDKYQLRQREGYHIRQIGTLNKEIAGRTLKEYYQDNVDKKKEYRKQNKEHIQQIKKQIYEKSKNIILQKTICECGCEINISSLLRHLKTKKHQNLLNEKLAI